MKVLIDTNIILDLLLEREPFFEYSYKLLKLCEDKKLSGYVSASQITDIFYIIRKQKGRSAAYDALGTLLEIVKVAPLGNDEVLSAFQKRAKDFEDSLVAECALSSSCAYIITRNLRDFEGLGVPLLTPEQYFRK